MAWQTPKTDWKIQPVDENGRYNGDWFNIADYNRITGNIEALHALALEATRLSGKKDLVRQRVYAYRRRPKPDRGHSINLIQYVSEAEGRPSQAII